MNEGSFIKQLRHNWSIAFKDKGFNRLFIIGMLLLVSVIWSFNHFFQWAQRRNGIVMNDPILNLFTPIDLSVPICYVNNSLILLCIILITKNPVRFLHTLFAYILVSYFRMLTIYLTPLDPPAGIIPLNDPVLMKLTYGDVMITKDLFFSGHVSTLLLLMFGVDVKWVKWMVSIALIFIALGILIMHVHYSVDVFAAPLFTILAWQAAKVFLQRTGK